MSINTKEDSLVRVFFSFNSSVRIVMKNLAYEMQGLTWQARKNNQQDAILIKNKVIYEKGRYSSLDVCTDNSPWCVAVADGISSQPNSHKAAIAVLNTVNKQHQKNVENIKLTDLQHALYTELNSKSVIDAATTMALIRHRSEDKNDQVSIQFLGDSRVYYFSHQFQTWTPLTEDDNFFNEMNLSDLDQEQELASMYYVLTGYFCANSLHEVTDKNPITHQMKASDVLMVCTDGVFDAAPHQEWPLIQSSQSLKQWLEDLVEIMKPTAGDNISLVLVRAVES